MILHRKAPSPKNALLVNQTVEQPAIGSAHVGPVNNQCVDLSNRYGDTKGSMASNIHVAKRAALKGS
jgi:hypothetical protein